MILDGLYAVVNRTLGGCSRLKWAGTERGGGRKGEGGEGVHLGCGRAGAAAEELRRVRAVHGV